MPTYAISFIDANNPSGVTLGGTGSQFTPTAEDITPLVVEDNDEFLHPQERDPDGLPGVALNDPSALGTTGFETGELVQYYAAYELTGSDGASGTVLLMSNFGGSGIQGYAATIPFVAGVTYTVGNYVADNPIPYADLLAAPCFAGGTIIRTEGGDRRIEDLRCGDMVATRDRGFQPIRWIGSSPLSADMLAAKPQLRPIRIKAGALGNSTPSSDLHVSPQHRVLVRSKIVQKMFGTDEVLVAAKQLLLVDGIDIAEDVESVEYYHILFDRHEVVISNGAETESLYAGSEALKAVGKAAQEEIFALFPELRDREADAARVLASGRMGRRLAMRHAQQGRPLVQ